MFKKNFKELLVLVVAITIVSAHNRPIPVYFETVSFETPSIVTIAVIGYRATIQEILNHTVPMVTTK